MSTAPPADEAAQLRECGLQVTVQRLAVLRAVHAAPHGTADEVEQIVRAELGTVSRQAVYDVLGTLTEKGLLRRIQPAGSSARYEDRVGDGTESILSRMTDVFQPAPSAI